jgi:hypothetical protein
MGRVVADASGECLVVWVVGVFLAAGFIDVIWVAVIPRLDGPMTIAADEP